MRGSDVRTKGLFSYVSCEARVPGGHPLRPIRAVVDEALEVLSPDFSKLYSRIDRPSILPETLLCALLVQAFYSVRSERQLMEELDYNLMFGWFVSLSVDVLIWDVAVFTKNRDRLLAGDVAAKFMAAMLGQASDKASKSTWSQCAAQFLRREAQQCYPCVKHRPRRPVIQESSRPGDQAMSHGASADGEPPRFVDH